MGGLVGTRAGLDILQKRRITVLLLLGLELRISQPAAHYSTDHKKLLIWFQGLDVRLTALDQVHMAELCGAVIGLCFTPFQSCVFTVS